MALMDVSTHDGWHLALAPLAGWPEVARQSRPAGALTRLATRFLAWRAQRETVRLLNAVDGATLRDLGITDIELQVYGDAGRTACAATTATGGATPRARACRELRDDVEQDVGAGDEIGIVGVFARTVADPADARHEDHRRRRNPGDHLGVVAGARGHPPRAEAALPRGLLHQRDDPLDRRSPARTAPAARPRSSPLRRPQAVRDSRRAPLPRACRRCSSGSRRSTVKVARDGMTLMAFGSKRMRPTVATVGVFEAVARSRRKVMTRAAAWPASRRIDIGVVPAWLATPSMVTRCQEMPCRFSTAPIGTPSRSSTGPCSMCSST